MTTYAKDGTYTSADRRVLRRARAEQPIGDQRTAIDMLTLLAAGLRASLSKAFLEPGTDAQSVMNEASAMVSGYESANYASLQSGVTRALPATPTSTTLQAVSLPEMPQTGGGRLLLTSYRTLYTSLEGASIHSPEADKLHREEFLELNPADAGALGIDQNRPVIVSNGAQELELSAALSDAVAPGSVMLPLYYDGGAVNRLLPSVDGVLTTVTVRPA